MISLSLQRPSDRALDHVLCETHLCRVRATTAHTIFRLLTRPASRPPRLARPSRSSLTSVSPRPSLPSIISPSEAQTADLGNTESAVPSVYGSESNPFNDPPDLGSITPLGEKPTALDTFSPVADKELLHGPQNLSNLYPGNSSKRRRLLCIGVPVAFLLLAIVLIPVGLLVIKPNVSGHGSTNGPSNTPNMSGPCEFCIPPAAIGTVLDSTKWLDWTDFNLTYTDCHGWWSWVGGFSFFRLNFW